MSTAGRLRPVRTQGRRGAESSTTGEDDEPSRRPDVERRPTPPRGGRRRSPAARRPDHRARPRRRRDRPARGRAPAGPPRDRPRRRPPGRAWPCAAGAAASCWSTGSRPRASSTPRRCPAWCAWASRSSPSTWPATAAPRACPPAATTSSRTPSCWPGCSTSSASAGRCSPATRWAGGSSPSWRRPQPDRAIAVVLIDAVVGDCWDRLITRVPLRPAGAAGRRRRCSWPTRCRPCRVLRQPGAGGQARPPGRARRCWATPRDPWRMLGPGRLDAAVRSAAGEMLEKLAEARHPGRGHPRRPRHRRAVPPPRSTPPAGSAGTLVTVKGGTHSWVLKDPETLPAIIAELLDGPPGPGAGRRARRRRASTRSTPRPTQIEAAFLGPHAWCAGSRRRSSCAPGTSDHHQARYAWTVEQPA